MDRSLLLASNFSSRELSFYINTKENYSFMFRKSKYSNFPINMILHFTLHVTTASIFHSASLLLLLVYDRYFNMKVCLALREKRNENIIIISWLLPSSNRIHIIPYRYSKFSSYYVARRFAVTCKNLRNLNLCL